MTSVILQSTPALLGAPAAASPASSANSESASTTPSPPPATDTTATAARTNRRKQLSPQRSVTRNDVRGRYFFLADATPKAAAPAAAAATATPAAYDPVARTDGTVSEADSSGDRRMRKVRPGAPAAALATGAPALRRTQKGKEPSSGTASS